MTTPATANTLADAVRDAAATTYQGTRPDDTVVSRSPALRDALKRIERVAPIDTSVPVRASERSKPMCEKWLERAKSKAEASP